MTTVYVVTFGEYSSTWIGGVYTSEDEANAVASNGNGYVESHELDPPLEEAERRHLRPGECAYSVSMNADGNEASANQVWGEPQYGKPYDYDGISVALNPDGKPRRLSAMCWARSEEHAIKILNDRRIQWMAKGSPVGATPDTHGWREAVIRIPHIGGVSVSHYTEPA